MVALQSATLADEVRKHIALACAFLRKRRADVDTVYPGAAGIVPELLPATFGVVEYRRPGRGCRPSGAGRGGIRTNFLWQTGGSYPNVESRLFQLHQLR